MDSLTHIVLGACIGEAVAGKKLGKKAMLVGALAQSTPDIDFMTTFWMHDAGDIVAHRGFTHSILFAILVTLLLGWLTKIIFRRRDLSWKMCLLLIGVNVFIHVFIDGFNAYGVGWLEPFSEYRFSFHVLFVADPFFSIWPFLGFMGLLILRSTSAKRKIWWKLGLGLAAIYLGYASINKMIVEKDVRKSIARQGIDADSYIVTPTPFNSWLWFVAVKDSAGYYISHRSVFDKKGQAEFTYFPRNDFLKQSVKNKNELKNLIQFADHYYTFEKRHDTVMINVLRFGQIVGWYNPREDFCFYYYFDRPGSNEVVAQRGRFKKWNRETIHAFLRRIGGH